MLNRFVFVYLDDILSFSKSREEYTQPVRAVLQRFLENSLFVNSRKMWVPFALGLFWATSSLRDGCRWTRQRSPTGPFQSLRSNCSASRGFYCWFIRNHSSVAAPLTNLTSVERPFLWASLPQSAVCHCPNPPGPGPVFPFCGGGGRLRYWGEGYSVQESCHWQETAPAGAFSHDNFCRQRGTGTARSETGPWLNGAKLWFGMALTAVKPIHSVHVFRDAVVSWSKVWSFQSTLACGCP